MPNGRKQQEKIKDDNGSRADQHEDHAGRALAQARRQEANGRDKLAAVTYSRQGTAPGGTVLGGGSVAGTLLRGDDPFLIILTSL